MTISVDSRFVENTLIDLVQIPTETPPGFNIEITDYLAELAKKEGLDFERQPVGKDMENIVISPSEEICSSRQVALVGHLDTVPVGNLDNWTKDPFGKDREGDFLYGRGATDMKAGVTAFLAVIKTLSERGEFLPITPVFVGTADEEYLMRGASTVLESKGMISSPEFVVIGEPTGLELGIAEKGLFHVELHSMGVSAHGSRPELGANAIEACIQVIWDIKKDLPTEPDPILGAPTFNLGAINGGSKINVVPDTCQAQLDFRFGPSYDSHLLENIVKEACKALKAPYGSRYDVIHRLPALSAEKDHPFIQSLDKELTALGKTPNYIGLMYATDAAVLVPEWKIPFLIFGPGDPDVLHAADEYVSISETITAVELLSNVLISSDLL